MNRFESILEKQREFFNTKITLSYDFRVKQLQILKNTILKYEKKILDSLYNDLKKSSFEAYVSEVGFTIAEIDFTIKNLKKWMKSSKHKTPLLFAPAKSEIVYEPLGSALIISPWNYPFQLLLTPLIASIAAGNSAILKPSELSPSVSKVLTEIIKESYKDEYISIIEGGVEETTELLKLNFDIIFFTGSTNVGKIVMEAASKNLTPVVLELGGKSPCIISENIDIKQSAKRVAWGKFLNAGQTCVAPDYLLIQKNIKNSFITELKNEIKNFFGDDIEKSPDYPRIITDRHFDRLNSFIDEKTVIFGGKSNKSSRYIMPTILESPDLDSKVMKEEIFGPILPIFEYDKIEDAIKFIKKFDKPLALYLFSKDKNLIDKVLKETTSGGVCINDTISHIATPYLPFGGVGASGMGSYHGKSGFDIFSHKKSVMKRGFFPEPDIKYPPYGDNFNKIKKLMRWFL
ncbi:aldehyde dehydrogenase [bacterium]|nr:aldehyde dehydrogenase [bacterium]